MKLSELKAAEIEPASPPKLSELSAADIEPVDMSTGEAMLHGGADYFTGGYTDEIAGALRHPIGAGKAIIGRGSDDPDVSNYEARRNEHRSLQKAARDQHPIAYHGTGIPAALLGPGKLLKGLQGLKAVAGAAGLGAASGLGNSEAELADQEYGKAATDTAIGGAVGGAIPAVGNLAQATGRAVAPAFSAIAPKLPAMAGAATERAVQASGIGAGYAARLPGGETIGRWAASKLAKPAGDFAQKTTESVLQAVQGTKYAQPLMIGLSRGDTGYAASYFMLYQSDPQFRRLVDRDASE